jgi:hypothetical protein
LKKPARYPLLFSSLKVGLNLIGTYRRPKVLGDILVRFKSHGELFQYLREIFWRLTGTVAQELRTVLKN